MRPTYLILGLVTLAAVLGLYMSNDPEHAARMSQMYRDSALSADTREMVIMGLAVVIGSFVVYLTMTRR
jgi:hypothetical protein